MDTVFTHITGMFYVVGCQLNPFQRRVTRSPLEFWLNARTSASPHNRTPTPKNPHVEHNRCANLAHLPYIFHVHGLKIHFRGFLLSYICRICTVCMFRDRYVTRSFFSQPSLTGLVCVLARSTSLDVHYLFNTLFLRRFHGSSCAQQFSISAAGQVLRRMEFVTPSQGHKSRQSHDTRYICFIRSDHVCTIYWRGHREASFDHDFFVFLAPVCFFVV